MADDEIIGMLEGLKGLSGGFLAGYQPFAKADYENRLLMARDESKANAEQGQWKERQGIETQNKIDVMNKTNTSITGYNPDGTPIYAQGKVTAAVKPETLYQPTDAQGNPIGNPTHNRPIVLPLPKTPVNPADKNSKNIDALQAQLDEVNNVHKAVKVLRDQFNQANNSSGVVNSVANLANKILPDSWTPETTSYEGLKKQLQPRIAFALIGSKQGLQGMGKSEGKEIPSLPWDNKKGNGNFDRIENQFMDKKKSLINRIQKLGGQPIDESGADSSPIGISPSVGTGMTDAQKATLQKLQGN